MLHISQALFKRCSKRGLCGVVQGRHDRSGSYLCDFLPHCSVLLIGLVLLVLLLSSPSASGRALLPSWPAPAPALSTTRPASL